LLKLDAIDQRLDLVGRRLQPTPTDASGGLELGQPAPPFQLPDATGKTHDLKDFRGGRLLLVNWSPNCGYCELLAPALAEIGEQLRRGAIELVLLSDGKVDANNEL